VCVIGELLMMFVWLVDCVVLGEICIDLIICDVLWDIVVVELVVGDWCFFDVVEVKLGCVS